MAVSTTTNRVPFAGNGVTTQFSYPHHVESTSHLVVVLKVNSTGVETVKTITTHYTVSGTLDANGAYSSGVTVTMLVAPATGETLLVYNDPTLTQTLDLGDNDSRPAVTLERRLDQMTLALQRLDSRVDRCVRLPEAFTESFDPILPGLLDDAGNGLLLLNSGATGFAAASEWPTSTDLEDAEENAAAAAASAAAAAASATAAATAETNAETAETNAETAETNAETAATNAASSASSASTSATNAAASATTATTQATNAATSATSASGSATTATTQASNASTSASNAATSATNAGNSATAAAASASAAATSETNAAASAAAAAASAASFLPASYEALNYTIACSVGSNAMTIALKDMAGNNCSAGSAAKFGFRNATAATGTFSEVSVTGALSTVISSGSTLGHGSGVDHYIYVGVLNNAGAAEFCYASFAWDEGSVITTTAEGGAGAADSGTTIYSTTARTGVPSRIIGRLKSNQATAGTWASVPTEISLLPFDVHVPMCRYTGTSSTTPTSLTETVIKYSTKVTDTDNAYSTATGLYTCPRAGNYEVQGKANVSTGAGAVTNAFEMHIYLAGTSVSKCYKTAYTTSSVEHGIAVGETIRAAKGNTIGIYIGQNLQASNLTIANSIQSQISIVWVGP